MKAGTFAKFLEKSKIGLKHASPTLLTILSVVGVIATAVLSSKATREYDYICKESEEPMTDKEKALTVIKTYAPAIAVGGATILSTVGANFLNTKRIAGLTAGYAMLGKASKDFEQKARELLGNDKVDEVKTAIMRNAAADPKKKVLTNDKYKDYDNKILYYESFRDEFFELPKEKVIEAEYGVNRKMAENGYVSLNTFYDLLDLTPIDLGDEIGWSYGVGADFMGYSWIDFKHETYAVEDGVENPLEAIYISFPYPPEPGFMD